jgi:hypothetical protein
MIKEHSIDIKFMRSKASYSVIVNRALTQSISLMGCLVVAPVPAQDVDPRGPVEYPGMTVSANAQGVTAPGFTFHDDVQKPSPWKAHWIWLGSDDRPNAAMFRKTITLAQRPTNVMAWTSADKKYRLYINGRLASRGPVDMGNDYEGGVTGRWFYDGRDLTPFFREGRNVIAVEVFTQWPANALSRGQPGFLFEAEVKAPGTEKTIVKSDQSWRGSPALQFPKSDTYDARKEPPGWRLAEFDDGVWSACHEIPDLWDGLIASDIPPLMEARYPVARLEGLSQQTVTNDCRFKVVFDRVLSAYPTLKVGGGKGAVLKIRANGNATMILGGGEQFFEFPFMTEIAPAFTVECENVTAPIQILDVGANFTSQPVQDQGAFECSDTKLNDLWKASRWAVQICLQTHHLDSPNHQEPICDPGDYVIESMVNYYAFAQPWLTRQDVRKFAWLLKNENYHNFHTSYSIAWLQMLIDYYDYTGDKTLVQEMAPYVGELLDTYASWRGTNGLISEAPNYMFMDWVRIGGFECHHPPAVIGQGYLTAFFYHGLEMGSRVAELTGDSTRVRKYAAWRRDIAAAFNHELLVADKGLYRDGKPFKSSVKPSRWLPADTDIETFSPHVNSLAVLFDLAPKKEQPRIMEKLLAETPLNTQPWFMYWVFQAMDHSGVFDRHGAEQLRRWKIVPETQSFRENWTGGDLSHGWCSSPLVEMSARVLGVTPSAPGFKTIAIRPTLCDLTWAKGRTPTPLGPVDVSWKLGDDLLRLDINVPANAEADVTLPISHFERPTVTMDGKTAEAVVHVLAGSHHFVVVGKLIAPEAPTQR